MINKYFFEIEFKQPLTSNEKHEWESELKFWKIFAFKPNRYSTNVFYKKERLFTFLGEIKWEHNQIAKKIKKLVIYYGSIRNNLLKEWKNKNQI